MIDIIILVYFSAALGLVCYGLNCYVMITLFWRQKRREEEATSAVENEHADLFSRPDLPYVLTQIPIYNEYNVVERIMRATCAMAYPTTKHEIQILDDSTDETRELVDRVATDLCALGHKLRVIRRDHRTGFKAGALANGLEQSDAKFVAIFDADFVPPPDFWQHVLPHFLTDPKLGLVQARWGHLNRTRSLLTRAQCIGIDGHFMVEQGARAGNGLFLNFNGTAGAWQRQAIVDAGGWQWDTLTEDMDLSYRMQLAGWGVKYLPGLVVPAEIPEDVSAFKSQQFRWAKGSIQTAIKLMPRLLRSRVGWFKKIQAFFHLTHYAVHPLMLCLALLALPVMLHLKISLAPVLFTVLAICLGLSMVAPSSLYVTSQYAAYPDWWRRLVVLPALVVVGVGVALCNTRAVLEAILGVKSGFVRTPKSGDRARKSYRIALPWLGMLEIVLGLYCAWSLRNYLVQEKYLVGPFLAIYAAGFLFIGCLTLVHALGFGKTAPAPIDRTTIRNP